MNAKSAQFWILGVAFFNVTLCSLINCSVAQATSALELVGASAPALGGAFCANKNGDASSLIYNPAALARSAGHILQGI